MLVKNEYYEIVIKEKNLVEVVKINSAKYHYFKNMFEDAYRAKNGKRYPLDKDSENGTAFIIADDENIYALLMDMSEQGFCDKEEAYLALVKMN